MEILTSVTQKCNIESVDISKKKSAYFDAYEMRILGQSFNYYDQKSRDDLEIMS